jgi:hypothetical protein
MIIASAGSLTSSTKEGSIEDLLHLHVKAEVCDGKARAVRNIGLAKLLTDIEPFSFSFFLILFFTMNKGSVGSEA